MATQAKNPDEYVARIEVERRPHVEALRALVKKTVPRASEGLASGTLAKIGSAKRAK